MFMFIICSTLEERANMMGIAKNRVALALWERVLVDICNRRQLCALMKVTTRYPKYLFSFRGYSYVDFFFYTFFSGTTILFAIRRMCSSMSFNVDHS